MTHNGPAIKLAGAPTVGGVARVFASRPDSYVILHNFGNKFTMFLSLSRGVIYFNPECLLW